MAATPGLPFVLFADRPPRRLRGWHWRPLPPEAAGLSQAMVNRHAKFFPHRLFPEAEVTVYVDANTLILRDLSPLVAEFAASGAQIGLFPHKERGGIAEELAFGLRVGKIPAAEAERGAAQIARYHAEGLPERHLFTENAILFRRHDAAVAAAMDLWWAEMQAGVRRDQISLPFVLHRTGLATHLWDWNYKAGNPYFRRYLHRRGPISDAGVWLKNQRHYGPLRGALLGPGLDAWARWGRARRQRAGRAALDAED